MLKELAFSATENCVCFNLRRVTRAVTQFYDTEMRRDGFVEAAGSGRGNRVELAITAKGRKQIEKLTPAWKSAQCAAVKTLGEKRWSAILSDLETAALALNK